MSKKSKVVQVQTDAQGDTTVVGLEGVQVIADIQPVKARGIGKFIIEKILTTNLTNKEILDEVIKEFDGAKTTMACIAWYKTKMRKEGKIGARVKAKGSVETQIEAEEVPA